MQTMAERSRVFDDQQDYYNTDWMSQEEKEVRTHMRICVMCVCRGGPLYLGRSLGHMGGSVEY